MSKSLENFTTIRQLLDTPLPVLSRQTLHPMALRLFVLQAQYRKPIDFTDDAIAAAQQSWQTLQEGLLFGYDYGAQLQWSDHTDPDFGNPAHMRIPDPSDAVQRFQLAMDDDFNSPSGLVVIFELAKELRKAGNMLSHQGEIATHSDQLREQWQTLVCLSQVLGLEAQPNPEVDRSATEGGFSEQAIEALIEERQAARQAKNYAESDRIRDQLKAAGITLIDQSGGITRWLRE